MDLPSEIYAIVLMYCHPNDFYALSRVSLNATFGARAVRKEYEKLYDTMVDLRRILHKFPYIYTSKYNIVPKQFILYDNITKYCSHVRTVSDIYRTKMLYCCFTNSCHKCKDFINNIILYECDKNNNKIIYCTEFNIYAYLPPKSTSVVYIMYAMKDYTLVNGVKHSIEHTYVHDVDTPQEYMINRENIPLREIKQYLYYSNNINSKLVTPSIVNNILNLLLFVSIPTIAIYYILA
jgi:hypothetical protein